MGLQRWCRGHGSVWPVRVEQLRLEDTGGCGWLHLHHRPRPPRSRHDSDGRRSAQRAARSAQPLHGRRLLCTQAQVCMAFVSAATAIRSEERYRYHARTHVKPEGLRMREVARPSQYLPSTHGVVSAVQQPPSSSDRSQRLSRIFSSRSRPCLRLRLLSSPFCLCSHAPLCSD